MNLSTKQVVNCIYICKGCFRSIQSLFHPTCSNPKFIKLTIIICSLFRNASVADEIINGLIQASTIPRERVGDGWVNQCNQQDGAN